MEIIKKLPTKKANTEKQTIVSMGLFFCPYCKNIVKRTYSAKRTKSCGCLNYPNRHGFTKTRLHNIWIGIKQRCFNKKDTGYHKYGARGISVCDEWKNSFNAFMAWSIQNKYNEHLELDRIDNNKNYSPENRQWITTAQNSQKKESSKINMEEANKIREFYKKNIMTVEELRQKYNFKTKRSIYQIIQGTRWKNSI